jgi:hypothetical protein
MGLKWVEMLPFLLNGPGPYACAGTLFEMGECARCVLAVFVRCSFGVRPVFLGVYVHRLDKSRAQHVESGGGRTKRAGSGRRSGGCEDV